MIIDDDSEFLSSLLRSYPGSQSLILIGSRARGDFTEKSDYDFYIVLSNRIAFLFYPKLKSIRKSLSDRYGAHVNIVPLTLPRIRKGKDIFLLRIRNEGKIVAGQDIRDEIGIRELLNLSTSELLMNCFASGMHLLTASSSLLEDESMSKKSEMKDLRNNCTKALRLFRDINSVVQMDEITRQELDSEIEKSQRTTSDSSIEANSLWLECRRIFFSLLSRLCSKGQESDVSSDGLAVSIKELNEGDPKMKKRLVKFFASFLQKKGNAFDFLRPDALSLSEIAILELLLSFNPKSDFKIRSNHFLSHSGFWFMKAFAEKTITVSDWKSIVKAAEDNWAIASLRV